MEAILVKSYFPEATVFIHELMTKIEATYSELNLEKLKDLELGTMMKKVKGNNELVGDQELFENLRK